MRGVPGSGKSTWLTNNAPNAVVCSADKFHINTAGMYAFDATKVREAHDWCLRLAVYHLRNKYTEVAVDNTNLKVFEVAPYYRLGEAFGYEVEVIDLIVPLALCETRNIHGVPPEKVRQMWAGREPLPGWWNVRTVVAGG